MSERVRWAVWAAGAALTALAGCHTSKLADTIISVEASALATFQQPVVGSGLSVSLSDQMPGCPLSENATISVNGNSAPFSTCLFGSNSGPPSPATGSFTGNPSFRLKVSDGGDSAEMDGGGLVPGVEATLLSPADGQVAPGGDLQAAVPPAMQNQVPLTAQFIYTDGGAAYEGEFTIPTSAAGTTVDFPAPQHPGHFTVFVLMIPGPTGALVQADISACNGFQQCFANPENTLGPLMVDVVQ
jgi:hypothetical protein